MKILLCGYTCPSCNPGSICPAWISSNQFSFANNALYDGWSYDIEVISDKYCEKFTIDKNTNGSRGNVNAFQINFYSGYSFEVKITAHSPCLFGERDKYEGDEIFVLTCPANYPANATFYNYCYKTATSGC